MESRRRQTVRGILRFYRDRYLPEAILTPSARVGLFAAACEVFAPGDRVLISPVTCHTVIESLLAAKVMPVFVDIELATGNIDIARLKSGLLQAAKGIVTTNLYGNPDEADELQRIAQRHGLFLIEDCAHVLQTSIGGRPLGTFGDISVFSFKKYFDEPGGVVTVRDPRVASRIRARIARESHEPNAADDRLRLAQYYVSRSTGGSFSAMFSSIFRAHQGSGSSEHDGEQAGEAEPLRKQVRTFPTTGSLLRVDDHLVRYEALVYDRVRRGRELIRECPLPARRSGRADHVCHLVVPFFSPERDRIIARLQFRGIPTYFKYAVPMNRLFAKQLPSGPLDEDGVDEWCRQILPIDLRYSREYLEEIRLSGGSAAVGGPKRHAS